MTKITIDRAVVEQVLNYWEQAAWGDAVMVDKMDALRAALRAALAEPVQEPVSVTDLQQALVETNLIDPDAIDDPEGYDYGSTVAQIDALHEMLFKSQRKPLTEVELEMAYRHIWRDLPTDFDHTSSGWIEQGIKYAERAHGIGEAK